MIVMVVMIMMIMILVIMGMSWIMTNGIMAGRVIDGTSRSIGRCDGGYRGGFGGGGGGCELYGIFMIIQYTSECDALSFGGSQNGNEWYIGIDGGYMIGPWIQGIQ